ncbi:MAG: radical SAM protein [Myxococcales bacterium]|nr:radical SAM protein [Myxococcales bacterium]
MSAAAERVGVTELYASIQGESTHMGRPCTFIRLAGCPLRCRWCDTEYSFDAGNRMAIDDVVRAVRDLGVPLVEVTGGEPLSQHGCRPLMTALATAGFEVLLETSGCVDMSGIDPRVTVIADLKCPGSGEQARNLWPQLQALRAQDELKIVVADEADVDWALEKLAGPLNGVAAKVLWSPVYGEMGGAQLAALILSRKAPGRMQIQLHKVLWPDVDRGV